MIEKTIKGQGFGETRIAVTKEKDAASVWYKLRLDWQLRGGAVTVKFNEKQMQSFARDLVGLVLPEFNSAVEASQ